MSFWASPFGRLIAVVITVAATSVAMFAIYAGVAIGINAAGFYIRTSDCPDLSRDTFPEECLAHLGDWLPGEEGDGKSDFVWLGGQAELSTCVRKIAEEGAAQMDAFFSEDGISPECWERYGDSYRLTGSEPKLEYRGRILDSKEINEFGFVTPTPTH